jgi:hypothetical protein
VGTRHKHFDTGASKPGFIKVPTQSTTRGDKRREEKGRKEKITSRERRERRERREKREEEREEREESEETEEREERERERKRE